jgi:hypothetical protein
VAKQVPAGGAGCAGAVTGEYRRFRAARAREPADWPESALNGAYAS